jgi:protein-disulfide isomerase
MTSSWKLSALSALGGAAIAVAIVYGAALVGAFPQDDTHIHAYLMAHPEIFAEMGAKYQADEDEATDRARQEAIDKLGPSAFFNPKVAYITGPANARTTLVEFFDYNCPHCRNSVGAVHRFYDAHKSDARFAFIEFPIFGAQSTLAARAAIAARRQPDKYIAFHFAMMEEEGPLDADAIFKDAKQVGLNVDKLKADMDDPAVLEVVNQGIKLAHTAGLDGTPEFIINGKSLEREVDDALLNQMVKTRVSRS